MRQMGESVDRDSPRAIGWQRACTIVLGLVLILGLSGQPAWSAEHRPADVSRWSKPVVIAVLAFRGKDETRKRWKPLIDYLNREIPGHRIQLEAYTYPELDAAALERRFDFALVQPSLYIQLSYRFGVHSPLATLVERHGEHALSNFGGTILALNARTEIEQLEDLRGRRIAASSISSLGSFQMQARELLQRGLAFPGDMTLLETGQPQDKAIFAVLEGKADVAFVRTGVLEAMIAEGKIKPGQFKVINRQSVGTFPHATSTLLYPEWPLASMPWANEDLARQVSVAILGLPHQGEVADAIGIHGFTVAGDYRPVDELMRELRLPPFDKTPAFTLHDIWERHGLTLTALILLVTTCIAVFAHALRHANRKLHHEREQVETTLRQVAEAEARFRAVFNNADTLAIQGFTADGRIIFWNTASERLFGYRQPEAEGRNIFQLLAPAELRARYQEQVRQLADGERPLPPGPITLLTKSGQRIPVLSSLTAIDQESGMPTIFAFEIDLRGQTEAEAARRESEILHRTVLASLGEGVYGIDQRGNCAFINQAALDMLGWREEDILGKNQHAIFHHHHADGSVYPRECCPIYQTCRDGRLRRSEEWFWRKDGTGFPVHLTVAPQLRDGQLVGAVAVFRDLSEKPRQGWIDSPADPH